MGVQRGRIIHHARISHYTKTVAVVWQLPSDEKFRSRQTGDHLGWAEYLRLSTDREKFIDSDRIVEG